MMTLIIPAYTAGPNIERTIESARALCDDVVIVSTCPYLSDDTRLEELGKVVKLPWNFVFYHGFGSLYNQGRDACKNNWHLLLGVAETVAQTYQDVHAILRSANPGAVFRCDHVNDAHTWKRIWNPHGGSQWSGIIHEEIQPGSHDGGLLFRMQDTDKVPDSDPLRNEVFRYIKTLSYNYLYHQLLLYPTRLGSANAGWLTFVNGAKESINAFCLEHADMLEVCIDGDAARFIGMVEQRMNDGKSATGVIYEAQGT